MFMAFPNVYATAFSGFYMALIVVLWLLILRGVAIELRSHQDHPLWREFWDTVFIARVRAARRGVRHDARQPDSRSSARKRRAPGHAAVYELPHRRQPGILDWYTGLVGLFTLAALSVHGALYLAWRTTGPCGSVAWPSHARRGRPRSSCGSPPRPPPPGCGPRSSPPSPHVPGRSCSSPSRSPGPGGRSGFRGAAKSLPAFLSSSAFLLGMLAATLAGQYPFWLRSTLDPSHSLTALNSASDHYGLRMALTWWPVGIALVAVYFTFLFRWMWGKVGVEPGPSYGSAVAGRVDSPDNGFDLDVRAPET